MAANSCHSLFVLLLAQFWLTSQPVASVALDGFGPEDVCPKPKPHVENVPALPTPFRTVKEKPTAQKTIAPVSITAISGGAKGWIEPVTTFQIHFECGKPMPSLGKHSFLKCTCKSKANGGSCDSETDVILTAGAAAREVEKDGKKFTFSCVWFESPTIIAV